MAVKVLAGELVVQTSRSIVHTFSGHSSNDIIMMIYLGTKSIRNTRTEKIQHSIAYIGPTGHTGQQLYTIGLIKQDETDDDDDCTRELQVSTDPEYSTWDRLRVVDDSCGGKDTGFIVAVQEVVAIATRNEGYICARTLSLAAMVWFIIFGPKTFCRWNRCIGRKWGGLSFNVMLQCIREDNAILLVCRFVGVFNERLVFPRRLNQAA